ncbi:MAG TPA: response regulator [Polyangiaceae bacterium]
MRRVAIADDTRGMRVVLSGILRDEGYDVREARDGADLLALVARFNPDVIVTDFRMPRMTGLDVLRVLREQSPRVRVILMTASPLEDVYGPALSLGAAAVLAKPFDLRDLLAAIDPPQAC